DPELLKILHKRYGSGYLDGYVKNNFESALKTVQGAKQFNYLTDNRAKFEEEVRAELERRLGLETDGQPLITVSFINVMDYDYDDEVNNQLNEIVKAENEAKSAEARAKTALQDGLAKENLAKGERDATKATADGELYKRQQEALGITAVQNALASSPTYIQLEQAKRWNGALPQFYGGTSPIPFFNVPTAAPASTPTQ
ncbi:MAG: SPFH domain-containing protein, partial [Parcubacteria group bacterium]